MAKSSPTTRQIEAAIGTLATLTESDHPSLDGSTRDEFSHVIHVLDEMIEERRSR